MSNAPVHSVELQPWSEGDFWLLQRNNTPEMTEHLGGPETAEQLVARHQRYLALGERGRIYRVVLPETGETAGSIGFWEHEWNGVMVWEAGWSVLPEFQGRGVAAAAARAAADAARALGTHRCLHAFPSVDHAASNAVCRKAGFELVEAVKFEYPKGRWITSNDWRLDLLGE
ncbi:GNAT family N-acetyltransferase [Kitasatospora sp. RB6PN24]|uniref:GNAT family N-acetyltransferase n=1 Tax=Kitasatospora humi TaxID=2893891 RepID=UPI001E4AEAC0|nr:GNAT family N-acetyltransferase [Kitasatospora humi]MCC9310484.1 GNAT family N-acetyltransferase [Kitasatospora humi]